MSKKKKMAVKRPALSTLENEVMKIVWDDQPTSAEEVRERLGATNDLKASTVRTLLRRLEAKGYVEHDVQGRTYLYRSTVEQSNVAASAVRSIVDKFCAGSVESLLVGLVDDKQISSERLKQLADKIAEAEQVQKVKPKKGRSPRK